MKTRRRDRHQPRRAHLPCRDRRARARRPGRGRHRPRHTAARDRPGGHRRLRRGRYRPGLRRPRAIEVEARPIQPDRAAEDPHHDQPRQPRLAFRTSFIPNDGVGLARLEFIITSTSRRTRWPCSIRTGSPTQSDRAQILDLTKIIRAAATTSSTACPKGVGTIAAAFWPKPVIVRLSDFKSNEYATLIGGRAFEPHEEQPDDRLPRRLALRPPCLPRTPSRSSAPR